MKKLMVMVAALVVLGSVTARAGHVGQVAAGSWKSDWIYAGNVVGFSPRNVWVDLWVHNLGFHKEVGIVWTDNGWFSANWALASYEFSFADGSEQWGVDIMPVGQFQWHRSGAHGWVELNGYIQTIGNNGKTIEYAIFYNDISNGNMYWDNNGGQNYTIEVVKAGVNGYVE